MGYRQVPGRTWRGKVALLAALVVLLAACSNGESDPADTTVTTTGDGSTTSAAPGTTSGSEPGEVIELEFWYFGGLESEIAYLARRTEEFNAQQDGIHVTFSNPAFADRRTILVTCSEANTCGDVIGGQGDEAPDYALLQNGAALDVEFPEILQWEDRFYPEAWAQGWYNGHLYNIPHNSNFGYLIANVDEFASAGLSHPADELKTWDDLVRVAAVMDSDDRAGMALNLARDSAHFEIQFALFGAGDRLTNAEGTELRLNSPAMLETLKLWRGLYPYLPDSALEDDYLGNTQIYAQGLAAMTFTGSWYPGVAQQSDFDFRESDVLIPRPLSPEPYGPFPQATNLSGTEAWYLNPRTEHKPEAWEFFTFLSNDETLNAWGCEIVGRIPTVKTALQQPCAAEANPSLVALDQEGRLWAGAIPQPSTPGQSAWEPFLSDAFTKGLTAPDDQLQALLDEAQALADPIFQEARQAGEDG